MDVDSVLDVEVQDKSLIHLRQYLAEDVMGLGGILDKGRLTYKKGAINYECTANSWNLYCDSRVSSTVPPYVSIARA